MEGGRKPVGWFFDNTLALSLWRALDFLLLFGLPVLAVELWNARLGAHSLEWLAPAVPLFRPTGGDPFRLASNDPSSGKANDQPPTRIDAVLWLGWRNLRLAPTAAPTPGWLRLRFSPAVSPSGF